MSSIKRRAALYKVAKMRKNVQGYEKGGEGLL